MNAHLLAYMITTEGYLHKWQLYFIAHYPTALNFENSLTQPL